MLPVQLLVTITFDLGVSMRWIQAPPDEIKAEEHFNVTYEMTLEESFWAWGVSKGVFSGVGPAAVGYT